MRLSPGLVWTTEERDHLFFVQMVELPGCKPRAFRGGCRKRAKLKKGDRMSPVTVTESWTPSMMEALSIPRLFHYR